MNKKSFYFKFALFNFNLSLIKNRQINDGITINAVIIKNKPQFPSNPSTKAPEDEANNVLPAVPTEANKAYWVAVKLRSTSREINATNATVANAAAKSSNITAKAKRVLDGPTQARIENKIFVAAIAIPAIINVLKIPDLMAIAPPNESKYNGSNPT